MTSKTTGTEGDQLSVSTDQGVVPQMRTDSDSTMTEQDLLGIEGLERALPLPLLRRRSGVYTRRRRIPILEKFPFSPLPAGVEEDEDTDLTSAEGAELDGAGPLPTPVPLPTIPVLPRYRYGTEELRVDVDGRAPTMTVSGVIPGGLFVRRLTWIARVKRTATGTYKGPISYRDGTSSLLPQTQVEVTLSPTLPIAR